MKIFISHAKKNAQLADKIVDKLLLKVFTLDSKNIFYTSKPQLGAKVSKKWRDEIREAIINSDIFIPIITKEFKKSEMCVSEVGGAWVLKKNLFPMILPPVTFKNFGVVIDDLQATKVNDKELILSFINDLESIGKLTTRNDIKLDKIVNDYIRSIKRTLQAKKKKTIASSKVSTRLDEIKPFFRQDGGSFSLSEFNISFLNEGAKLRVVGIKNLSKISNTIAHRKFPIWCDLKQRFTVSGKWPAKYSQIKFVIEMLDMDENQYQQTYINENKNSSLTDPQRL